MLENTGTANPQAGNPETTQQPQAGQEPNSQNNPTTQPNTVKELPDWAQRELAEARNQAAQYRTEKQQAAETARLANEAKLKEQGAFQKLAEDKASELAEVKPQLEQITQRYSRLSELIAARFQAETKDWPKEAKDLLPDGKDPLDYFEAVEKLRPLAEKLKGGAGASTTGTARANPKPTGGNNPFDPETLKARMRQMRGL